MFSACKSEENSRQAVDYTKLSDAEKRLPEYALAGLATADGLEVSLFAADDMLVNPTNMDIDDKGRVWVCEGFNYRNEFNPDNPYREKGDRILILEDTDGDGKADSRKVFYQGEDINSALGIAVIGEKIIVSASPNVFVFTDADGDDIPDKKEVLFQGIAGKQHDHGMHAFTLGPDGKLYFNFGNAGEQLLDKNGQPIRDPWGRLIAAKGKPYRQGMVFRADRDGSHLEVLGHNFRNNYEVAVDAFGSLWQSDNDDDGNMATRINFVMEYGNYGFTDEKTGAGWRVERTGMNPSIPLQHWHLNDPGVVPNLLQNGAGSPTGMIVYEGDLLPEIYRNQMIHCDAGPRQVRAYPVKKDGAGYSAESLVILEGKEDEWFRPSDVCVAPDGSLLIADWYDPGVGGHAMGDTARGRIFRIAPPKKPYEVPEVDYSNPTNAAQALQSPNLATRSNAWLALHEMGADAETALLALWENGSARNKARALWLLGKIDGKASTYVDAALAQDNEDLRITGIRLLRQSELDPLPWLRALAKDPSPQIRREVLIALKEVNHPEKAALWASLAQQTPPNDRWYLEALGIASDDDPDAAFIAWQQAVGENWSEQTGKNIVWRSRSRHAIPLLGKLISSTQSADAAERYFRSLDFQENRTKNELLASLLDTDHPESDRIQYLAFKHMDAAFAQSNRKVRKAAKKFVRNLDTEAYLKIVSSLNLTSETKKLLDIAMQDPASDAGGQAAGLLDRFGEIDRFSKFIQGKGTESEKVKAIAALGRISNDRAYDRLEALVNNSTHSMNLRKAAIQQLGNGWNGETRVANLLESGKLAEPLQIAGASRLLNVWRPAYKRLAAQILNLPAGGEGEAIKPIHELVKLEGDAQMGHGIYQTYCLSCHQVKEEGINFGPNLTEIGSKMSKDALYGAIINPSAGISFGYEAWLVEKKDGTKFLGFMASQAEDEIVLRMNGGTDETIRRKDIRQMEMQESSLMTAGLHQIMSEEDLVNLVEWLTEQKKENPALATN
ncbi:MAG: PVC-type heme-binding CxxCH protein [Bacteroidota bacterium]